MVGWAAVVIVAAVACTPVAAAAVSVPWSVSSAGVVAVLLMLAVWDKGYTASAIAAAWLSAPAVVACIASASAVAAMRSALAVAAPVA